MIAAAVSSRRAGDRWRGKGQGCVKGTRTQKRTEGDEYVGRAALAEAARILATSKAVHMCERVPVFGRGELDIVVGYSVLTGEERARVEGVTTCSSPWACVHCAERLYSERAVELDGLIRGVLGRRDRTGKRSDFAHFVTLTVRHAIADDARDLTRAVGKAFTRLQTGRAWLEFKRQYGIIGIVRAAETTVGPNGWHPHLHTLFVHDREWSKDDALAVWAWLDRRWRVTLGKLGRTAEQMPSEERGVDVREMTNDNRTNYLSKMGLAPEIARAGRKKARKTGHRTPWELLADCARGDEKSWPIWQRYTRAMRGVRAMTWSKGLRERYAESIDAAIADAQQQTLRSERIAATVTVTDWKDYVQGDPSAVGEVLAAALAGGQHAVDVWLADQYRSRYGVDPPRIEYPPPLTDAEIAELQARYAYARFESESAPALPFAA